MANEDDEQYHVLDDAEWKTWREDLNDRLEDLDEINIIDDAENWENCKWRAPIFKETLWRLRHTGKITSSQSYVLYRMLIRELAYCIHDGCCTQEERKLEEETRRFIMNLQEGSHGNFGIHWQFMDGEDENSKIVPQSWAPKNAAGEPLQPRIVVSKDNELMYGSVLIP